MNKNLNPFVSVVIPVYNGVRFIEASIESVLKQSFPDFELLVVNDCSTDGTVAIVEQLCANDSRIRLINIPSNMGAPAGPRNIGVKHSVGKWIAFLDADDIWHPAKLERQLALLKRTGAKFCSTQMSDFVDEGKLLLHDAGPDDFEWISFIDQLIKFRTPTSSVVVERCLAERYPFNESITFKAREDLDCWLHCHEEIGRSIKISQPMMGYRIMPGQISSNKWIMFRRHLHVLNQYRFRTGGRLYFAALLFTVTHFMLASYYRLIKRTL
jgi:teichuronic acid biosynthesis glycosyltransferase TuaG